MFPTVSYQIRANRYTSHSDWLDFEGFDFTGAVFKVQIRDRKNGGAIRADVVPTVMVVTSDGVTTSRVSWTISEAAMRAMPTGADVDSDVVLFFDLHITPAGVPKFVAVEGTFKVKAGVTQ